MARVVRFHQIGGPEVLRMEEEEVPKPGSGEIQIKVKALGLNRAESLFRSGQYIMEPKLPSKLGYEAAGTVESLGSGVTDFAVGDAVSVVPPPDQGKFGVYGELVNVPAQYVIKHPSNLSFEEAAAVWMQYMTAYGALIAIANIKKEDFVVIPAASSSVGLAAIELTNLVGATPIATTRTSAKRKALQDVGATHVIVTEEENLTERIREITKNKGARVVFNPIGGKIVYALADGMSNGGILFQYGLLGLEKIPFPLSAALLKGLNMRGYTLFEVVGNKEKFELAKKFIFNALQSGKLKPTIAKIFPFEEIVEAHRYLESNEQFGKIVVRV